MNKWMIYGANGYTGELLAREAAKRQMTPILAGRSDSVRKLASELGLDCRLFSLDEAHLPLDDVDLLVNCAGPFSKTVKPALLACIKEKTHYLDITGEIEVFQYVFEHHRECKDAEILAIPGVGFDVVPTDCMAAQLAEAVKSPKKLIMAFASKGAASRGTMKTSVEGFKKGTCRRINSTLQWESPGHGMKVPFSWGTPWCLMIPWGDVVTAYQSTGCPNIEVYIPFSPTVGKAAGLIHKAVNLPFVEDVAKKIIGAVMTGPGQEERDKNTVNVYGQIMDEDGKWWSKEILTPEGYNFTVSATLASVNKVLEGGIEAGVKTPSQAFGSNFVFSIDGVKELKSLTQVETLH